MLCTLLALWYNRFVKALTRGMLFTLYVILFAFAFGSGYWLRGWQLGLSTIRLPGVGQSSGEIAEPIIQDELYQQVWTLLERDYYADDPSVRQRIYGSVRGLVEAYDDPYTYFVEPQPRELERDQLRGRFGGIGAWIDATQEGYVLRPIEEAPAAQAGILAGDMLVAVDDVAVSAETAQDTVLSMVRGPVDSEVCLGLLRPDPAGGAPTSLRICVIRAEIETPSVQWRLLDDDPATANIGYIQHTLFSERSADEMLQAIQELQEAGADRFILDLRGNPGGLVTTAVDVADLWLEEGTILYERNAKGEEREFRSKSGDVSDGAPLVVLVDGGSASASEIVAGALRDRDRAQLVGTQTFGKGSVQLVHDLIDESSLHVTTAHWFTPSRLEIAGVGLTPDVVVASEGDPLASAVEVIQDAQGQAAASSP